MPRRRACSSSTCRSADGCPERFVVAHLGQSLDGRIAAANGASRWVTGEQDIVHNHRMRALFDAVVVGAGTVRHDDPQLTVRAVPGPHPVRVVLDTQRRLGPDYRVFNDGDGADPAALRRGSGEARRAARAGRGGGRRDPGRQPLPARGARRAWPARGLRASSSRAAGSPCRASSPPAACTGCRSRSRR